MNSPHRSADNPHQSADPPRCGMMVDPQRAAGSFEYGGQTYYFCALGCREKFKADPERYLAILSANDQPPATAGGSDTLVAPIGIQRAKHFPVSPEPVVTSSDADKKDQGWLRSVEYTCPMHPQIVRDAP